MGEWTYIGTSNSNYLPGQSFDFNYAQYKEIALYLRETTNADRRIYNKIIYTMDNFLDSIHYDGYRILFVYHSASANVFGAVRLVSLTEGKIYIGVYNTSMKIEVYAR